MTLGAAPPAPSNPPGPLDGIRVLELSSFISASYTATVLGDFGADVIKVERPGTGDPQRGLGTFVEGDERSLWWHGLARNKRSVTLDLRVAESRPVLEKLVEWADVVIENFRPGTLERWGIGWDWIHETNPAASLLRVSGYGQSGPMASRPSFERVAQAYSGLMYVTGEPDGPPQRTGVPVCDYTTGLWGAIGLLLALVHQLRSGQQVGQVVDQAIYASVLPFTGEMAALHDLDGTVVERTGNCSANTAPGEACRTRDGRWVFVAVTGEAVFGRAMAAIDRPELVRDPRFADNNGRLAHRDELDSALAAWVAAHDYEDVLRVMEAHAVPAGPVQSVADLLSDPQTAVREDFVDTQVGESRTVRTPGIFPKLSATPGSIRRAAPLLGEHDDEVLEELGVTADRHAQRRAGPAGERAESR